MKKHALIAFLAVALLTSCAPKQKTEEVQSAQISEQVNIKDLSKIPVKSEGEWVNAPDGTKYFKNKGTFYDAFDTVIQVTFYTKDEAEFDKAFKLAKDEFERLHRLYDKYHAYEGVTNVYTLNQEAGKGAVKVDPDLFSLLKFSKDEYAKGLGKTNIALGAVLSLWHDAREEAGVYENGVPVDGSKQGEAKLPDRAALEEAAKHVSIDDLILNEKDETVELKDPKMSLDVGAVAKGYATELVARKLEAAGVEHGLISAGGNVRTIGLPVDGRTSWSVGIQNPDTQSSELADVFEVGADMSVVTSGDYQRYYIVDGKKYNHIIDPLTLMPGDRYSSVTVITKNSGLADFLSTAFFLASPDEAKELEKNFAPDGIEVFWIKTDGTRLETPGVAAMRQK